jgi:hypothetical protein
MKEAGIYKSADRGAVLENHYRFLLKRQEKFLASADSKLNTDNILLQEDVSEILEGQHIILNVLKDFIQESIKKDAKDIYNKTNEWLTKYIRTIDEKLHGEIIDTFDPCILEDVSNYAENIGEQTLSRTANRLIWRVKDYWHGRFKEYDQTWIDEREMSMKEYYLLADMLRMLQWQDLPKEEFKE